MQSAIRVFFIFWALVFGILGYAPAFAAPANEPSHVNFSQPEGEGAAALTARLERILNRLESRRGVREANASRLGFQLPSHSRPLPLVVIRPSALDPVEGTGVLAQDDLPVPVLDASQSDSAPAGRHSPDAHGNLPPAKAAPEPGRRPTPAVIPTPMEERGDQLAGRPATAPEPTAVPLPIPRIHDLAGKPDSLQPPVAAATPATGPDDRPWNLESAGVKAPPLFAEPLRRMMRTKERRIAEATRLGIILPSQGGSGAHASEPLQKICVALGGMIDRAPANSPINFGFYPG